MGPRGKGERGSAREGRNGEERAAPGRLGQGQIEFLKRESLARGTRNSRSRRLALLLRQWPNSSKGRCRRRQPWFYRLELACSRALLHCLANEKRTSVFSTYSCAHINPPTVKRMECNTERSRSSSNV